MKTITTDIDLELDESTIDTYRERELARKNRLKEIDNREAHHLESRCPNVWTIEIIDDSNMTGVNLKIKLKHDYKAR